MKKLWIHKLLAGCAAFTLLSACSHSGSPQHSSPRTTVSPWSTDTPGDLEDRLPTPIENVPSDIIQQVNAFYQQSPDTSRAFNLAMHSCITAQGFTWDSTIPMDISIRQGPGSHSPLSVNHAQQQGYSGDTRFDTYGAQYDYANTSALPDGYWEALQGTKESEEVEPGQYVYTNGCFVQASQLIFNSPLVYREYSRNYISPFRNYAVGYLSHKDFQQVQKAVETCLKDKYSINFERDVIYDAKRPYGVLPPRDVAIAEAQCREEHGWEQTVQRLQAAYLASYMSKPWHAEHIQTLKKAKAYADQHSTETLKRLESDQIQWRTVKGASPSPGSTES